MDQVRVTTQALEVISLVSPPSPTTSLPASTRTTCTENSEAQIARWDQEDQEAEELLIQQVEKLCQILWPAPDSLKQRISSSQAANWMRQNKLFRYFVPTSHTPRIERLKGGDYNHITGITLPSSHAQGERNLILRVPRWANKRVDRDVAILEYVRQRTSIPVATIAATDFSCNNPFEKPYLLQHRVSGIDLSTLWDDLSHSQRRTIAVELGRIVRTLLSLQSPVAGHIEAMPSTAGSLENFSIVPFELEVALDELTDETKSSILIDHADPRAHQTTLDVFTSQFQRWKTVALAHNCGDISAEVELLDGMLKAVREMDDLGLFQANWNCLCHVDLHQGNIMTRVRLDGSIEIVAILDWDEAIYAPNFVNCHPPGWIWGYEFADRVDENDLLLWPYELEGANNIPPTPEQQELKRLFEEYAGADYLRLAYDQHYRLSRGLFRIAIDGMDSNSSFDAAERILREWESLRQSLTIAV